MVSVGSVKSQLIKLHIWDTGGAEKFRALQPLYYREAKVAILTYAVDDRKSFEAINFWFDELHKNAGLA